MNHPSNTLSLRVSVCARCGLHILFADGIKSEWKVVDHTYNKQVWLTENA